MFLYVWTASVWIFTVNAVMLNQDQIGGSRQLFKKVACMCRNNNSGKRHANNTFFNLDFKVNRNDASKTPKAEIHRGKSLVRTFAVKLNCQDRLLCLPNDIVI